MDNNRRNNTEQSQIQKRCRESVEPRSEIVYSEEIRGAASERLERNGEEVKSRERNRSRRPKQSLLPLIYAAVRNEEN